MNRDRIEKEQVARKIGEIVPFMKTVNRFAWVEPDCMADPVYEVMPDTPDNVRAEFRPFHVNLQTGWHDDVIYRDEKGVHRMREGTTPVRDEWFNYCCRAGCVCGQSRTAHIE